MYTASDIRNVEFSKNMGGYKVAEVEAFAESCAQSVEALTAEKEELTKKLGILADKLVEYRRDEDSIRSALLSAQRTGDAIVREANEKAEKILADATQEADEIVRNATSKIAQYEKELARVKGEVNDFKAGLLAMYKDHIALLKNIPSYEAAPVKETVVEPVQTVVEPVKTVASAEEPVVEVTEEVPDEEPMKVVADPVAPEVPARSKFANLKFGEDYSLEDDQDD